MSLHLIAQKARRHRIDLFWRVAGQDEKAMLTLAPLFKHWDSYPRCNDILLWCINNKVVGKELGLHWIHRYQKSFLEITKYILGRIEKNEKHAILVGRDYISR